MVDNRELTNPSENPRDPTEELENQIHEWLREWELEGDKLKEKNDSISNQIEGKLTQYFMNMNAHQKNVISTLDRYKEELVSKNSNSSRVYTKYSQKVSDLQTAVQRTLIYCMIVIVLLLVVFPVGTMSGFFIGYAYLITIFQFMIVIIFVLASHGFLSAYKIYNELNSGEFNDLNREIKSISYQKLLSSPGVWKADYITNDGSTQNGQEDETDPKFLHVYCQSTLGSIISDINEVLFQYTERFPLIKDWYQKCRTFAKWSNTCDEIDKSLRYFGIFLTDEIDKIRYNPSWISKIENDEISREKHVMNQLANVDSVRIKFGYQTLNLLFENYKGKNTRVNWEAVKNNDSQLNSLANIAYNSGLIQYNAKILQLDEFKMILKKTDDFDVHKIFLNCLLFQRVTTEILLLNDDLERQGIHIESGLGKSKVVQLINFDKPFEENLISILTNELSLSISSDNKWVSIEAIIALLLSSDSRFRDLVCRNAAYDNCVIQLMSYLELKKRKVEERQEIFISDLYWTSESCRYLEQQIDGNSNDFDPIVHQKFQIYKKALSGGRWIDDDILLTQETFMTKIAELAVKVDKQYEGKKYQILHKIIEKNLENININIVDKAIDAKLFSTYVILTHSTDGPLVECIGKLNAYDKAKDEVENIEEKYGISICRDGKPKYHFENYLKGTLIGIIDEKTSFSQFKDEFISDLQKIFDYEENELNVNERNWNLGIVLLRIIPSKYSFGMDDRRIRTRDLHVARKITRLLNKAEILSIPEKAALEVFDKSVDLLDVINHQTIYNIVYYEGMKVPKAYENLLKSEDLKTSLFSRLEGNAITSLKELAIEIKRHGGNDDTKKYYLRLFNTVLASEYYKQAGKSIENSRMINISNDLFEALDAVSTLWDR